jgi:uncharacterized protein
MRFWDSSAIVPLLVSEPVSRESLELYSQDKEILVWVFTPTEVVSALCRKLREGSITRESVRSFKRELSNLMEDWSEITAVELVRERANRLLEVHSLRAADALQLASALVAVGDQPQGVEFVTFDETLAEAAEKEGFKILP